MGNQLVGIAPSQIFPVDYYLTDYGELQFEQSMGSTRFFKVAKAKSHEGSVVVKVFAIHDPSLPLASYRDRLDYIRDQLTPAVNCLPFQRVVLTERAALIIREFVKQSLYDRISTRPFLTTIEKKWITFQILYALHQCHKLQICHGDIKLENILLTSWNWVLLGDFASFKPTYLPEDNPADYNYFFDTSRRRTCYIAPERFVQTLNNDFPSKDGFLVNETPCSSGDLLPSMDIFSAGCALLELWGEGSAPFDLSQLLAYKVGEYYPKRHLESISDTYLRELITSMIHIDPKKRLSAEVYLDNERGRLFPEYFYKFLQLYMLMFSSNPIVPFDEKILRLHQDIGDIIKTFTEKSESNENNQICKRENPSREKEDEEVTLPANDSEGLIIMTSLVTSCIRGLRHCNSKINALDILLQLSAHTSSETILDRILPYILLLTRDQSTHVKVYALNTLTSCLCLVTEISRSDYNVFPEYVLPIIAPLATDNSVVVRAAYAKNIATLASTAVNFLNKSQNYEEMTILNYDNELTALHELVQQTVSSNITDTHIVVKQTLMEHSVTPLYVFFGKHRANDVLLSHIITFLNDKSDRHLRASFFDGIIGVAACIGWHCSSILLPLLQQGLTDPSENVITKAIYATRCLTEIGLLHKLPLIEFISGTACYLNHPNAWIRHEMCGLICKAADKLSPIDVQCKIMPAISPHLKNALIQCNKPELLLASLQPPISRAIYDSVIKFPDIELFLDSIKERCVVRSIADKQGTVPQYKEMGTQLNNLYRRLQSDGLTDKVENQLLLMSKHLENLSKSLRAEACKNKEYAESNIDGVLDLTNDMKIKTFVVNLSQTDLSKNDAASNAKKSRKPTDEVIMNSEWQHMFGGTTTHNEGTASIRTVSTSQSDTPTTMSLIEHSLPEKSYIQCRFAECSLELRSLTMRQQERYSEAKRSREWAEQKAWKPSIPPPGWRLRGSLVAHLHEHRGAVTKIESIPDSPLFASCSTDGIVRLWDCAKMEGHNIANRSKQMYNCQSGSLNGLAVCDSKQSVAVFGRDGSISVLRLDPTSSKMTPIQTRQLDSKQEGCAVDMHYMDAGSQSMLVYATLYGSLVGWDLRAPGCAWRLENGLRYGLISSFCIDSQNSWLALGTSTGQHVCWDLRFQLPIATINHPYSTTSTVRIRKVICHPTEPSWFISSINCNNEVSMWSIESASRQAALWASPAPPLTHFEGSTPHTVSAMFAGSVDRAGFIITGSTDQKIRFWDLEKPADSFIAVQTPNDTTNLSGIKYNQRLMEGASLITETLPPSDEKNVSGDDPPMPGPVAPPAGHHDALTDLAMVQASQCLLISAARDGTIKVWK